MTNGSTPAGWYQDPTGQGEGRYWNGSSWTQSVNKGGQTVNVPIDPSQAETPPVAGTQQAAPAPAAQQTQPTTVVQQSSHSALGTIIGVVVALFAVVVILAVIGNATSDDSPTQGTDAPAEQPADGGTSDGGTSDGGTSDGG